MGCQELDDMRSERPKQTIKLLDQSSEIEFKRAEFCDDFEYGGDIDDVTYDVYSDNSFDDADLMEGPINPATQP